MMEALPPIVVYQMGKVASRCVVDSLSSSELQNPLYHVHVLSKKGIRRTQSDLDTLCQRHGKTVVSRHLEESKKLRERLDKETVSGWKVITLVRDPVARHISEMFENARWFYPETLDADGLPELGRSLAYLTTTLTDFDQDKDKTTSWFDQEFQPALNIDVYARPFQAEEGYTIISGEKIELLILRTESLDQTLATASLQFLGLSSLRVLRANLASQKPHAATYASVLEKFRLPRPVLERIYSSKFARHFFTAEERQSMLHRWLRH